MQEVYYTELATTVDEIAECIRALGLPAPATYSEFLRLASIPETHGVPKAKDMSVCWKSGAFQVLQKPLDIVIERLLHG